MKKYALFLLGLAALLALGGAYAYIRFSSSPSLIVSLASAVVLTFSATLALRERLWGLLVGALTVVGLNIFFLIRLLKTHKFMPAGLFVLLTSLIGIPLLRFLTRSAHSIVIHK